MKSARLTWSLLAASLLGVGAAVAVLRGLSSPGWEQLHPPRSLETPRAEDDEPKWRASADQIVSWIQAVRPRGALQYWSLIVAMETSELEKLAAQLLEDRRQQEATWHFVLRQLALREPARALAAASRRDRHGVRDHDALRVVFTALLFLQPGSVEPWLAGLPRLERRRVETLWLAVLGGHKPQKYADAASNRPWLGGDDLEELFTELASQSPENAVQQALALPRARQRDVALGAALKVWSGRDAGAAFAWLRQHGGRRIPGEAVLSVLRACAERHPRTAMEWVAGDSSGLPLAAARPLLAIWAERDLSGARAWVATRPIGEQAEWLPHLLAAWAKSDPAAATAAGFQLSGYSDREAVANALGEWRKSDPQAARACIATMRSGPAREQALAAWMSLDSDSVEDLRHSLDLLRALPGGANRVELEEAAKPLGRLAGLDFEAALAWARAEPDLERQELLLAAVAYGGVHAAPARAANLLLEQIVKLKPGEVDDRLYGLMILAGRWATRDPVAALRWSESKYPALSGTVVSLWVRWDPAAAFAAVEQMSADQRRQVLPDTLSVYAMSEPAAAAGVALQMPPGEAQRAALVRVGEQWLSQYPEAARAWIESIRAHLSRDDLERLGAADRPR